MRRSMLSFPLKKDNQTGSFLNERCVIQLSIDSKFDTWNLNFGLEFGLARKKVGNFLTPIFRRFSYLISLNSIWHPIYRCKRVVSSFRISYQLIFRKRMQVLDLWNRKCTYNWPFFGTKSAKTGWNKQTGAIKQVISSVKHL